MKENIELNLLKDKIHMIRGHRVMTDFDLAELYQVPTKSLNLAIKRNSNRFPEDFFFQLTEDETDSLRFQFETSKKGRGGRRYLPHVFTEHGVAMLSSVLRSDTAVAMNIFIIRAFIKMREFTNEYKDLAIKVGQIESKQREHGDLLRHIHNTVKYMIEKPIEPKVKIGFIHNEGN